MEVVFVIPVHNIIAVTASAGKENLKAEWLAAEVTSAHCTIHCRYLPGATLGVAALALMSRVEIAAAATWRQQIF